jgi:hypothetical protein
MRGKRGAYRFMAGQPKGQIPLGRHRRMLEDSIEIDFQDIRSEDVDWIDLDQDRRK